MLKNNFLRFILFVFILNFYYKTSAHFPINFFKNYDINFRTERWNGERFEFATLVEGAIGIKGKNPENETVNILQIWNKDQDALAMLRGFPIDTSTELGKIISELNMVSDDGIRGHFLPNANLSANMVAFFGQYFLPCDFSVNLFVPVYSMHLKDVEFKSLTDGMTSQDDLVRKFLTNDFRNLVKSLGGLDISGWKKTSIGDVVSYVEWSKNFPQGKPVLKNVHLDIRLGFSFPTAQKKDEDKLFSIPFGNDGSWGFLFGGGIDLSWGSILKGGVYAEFLQSFATARDRRIKTDVDQTDLLFLVKTKVLKEVGFNQMFNLYLEANRFFRGFSFRTAYQYFKHGDDKFWLFNNEFSDLFVNTAESLQGWTIHQFLFFLNYDFLDESKCQRFVPRLSVFYKFPFNGHRSVLAQTFGVDFSVSF